MRHFQKTLRPSAQAGPWLGPRERFWVIDYVDRTGELGGGFRLRESRSWVCFAQWEVPAAPTLRSPPTGWRGMCSAGVGGQEPEKAGKTLDRRCHLGL